MIVDSHCDITVRVIANFFFIIMYNMAGSTGLAILLF